MRAQSATEFMVMFSMVVVIFTLAVFIYAMDMKEAVALRDSLEATRLCLQVSSTINSFSSLSGNSTYAFGLPDSLNYKNYTIWIVSEERFVKVDYENSGVGCSISVVNISNSSGSRFFRMVNNATLKNNGGVLIVEP